MSPQEHYALAEDLRQAATTEPQHGETEKYLLSAAQVHATLAVAGFQAAANQTDAEQASDVREFIHGAMGGYPPRITTVVQS